MSNSLGGLGVGLSLVCGCLVLALVGELYYLLWWKKRVANREEEEEAIEDECNSSNYYAKGLFGNFMCWKKKKPSSSFLQGSNTNNNISAIEPSLAIYQDHHQPDLELGATNDNNNKELLVKPISNNNNNGGGGDQESVELELMRLHNLAGPPRFLFTIKEETREDLESEDGKSRSRKGSRTGSLSELVLALDTPNFLTPLASPRLRSPNSNNLNLESYHHLGFNPLFEASVEAELNRLRSSPPPKFKFLRDAEEKMIRRLLVEEIEAKSIINNSVVVGKEEEVVSEGSFLGFIVGVKNKEGERENENHQHHHHQLPGKCPSSSSQVLPLASSPTTTLRPVVDQKKTLQNYCIS